MIGAQTPKKVNTYATQKPRQATSSAWHPAGNSAPCSGPSNHSKFSIQDCRKSIRAPLQGQSISALTEMAAATNLSKLPYAQCNQTAANKPLSELHWEVCPLTSAIGRSFVSTRVANLGKKIQ